MSRLGKLFEKIFPERKTKNQPQDLFTEPWGPLFSEANEIAQGLDKLTLAARKYRDEESDILQKHLSEAFRHYQALSNRYQNLALRIIELIDDCEAITGEVEFVEIFKRKLLNILAQQEIEPITPKIGDPISDICEKVDKKVSVDLPAGRVAEIITKAYISKGGQVVRQAKVVVTVQPPVAKEPSSLPETATPAPDAKESSPHRKKKGGATNE